MNTPVSQLDWAIIAIYLFGVVGLGIAAGFLQRKGESGGEGGHYFLAGNTLKWPVIGLAMFAANISTVHLVQVSVLTLALALTSWPPSPSTSPTRDLKWSATTAGTATRCAASATVGCRRSWFLTARAFRHHHRSSSRPRNGAT